MKQNPSVTYDLFSLNMLQFKYLLVCFISLFSLNLYYIMHRVFQLNSISSVHVSPATRCRPLKQSVLNTNLLSSLFIIFFPEFCQPKGLETNLMREVKLLHSYYGCPPSSHANKIHHQI